MKEDKTTKKNVKRNTKGNASTTAKKKTNGNSANAAKKVSTSKKASTTKTSTNKSGAKKPVAKKQPAKGTTKKQTPKTSKNIVTDEVKEIKNEIKETKVEEKTEVVVPKKEVAKQQKNKSMESTDFGGDEIRKLLIIIGAVCAVMLAFYFITEVVVNNKKKEENNDKKPAVVDPVIQYEEILMGSILNQAEADYYVLAYDPEDPMLSIYNNYISSYKGSDEPLKVYKVDLSKDYNKSYLAEESYLTGTDVSAVKVKGTTLIRVSEKSVYKSFEGKDAIIGRFKYMLNLD